MGRHLNKYLAKLHQQKVNSQDNKLYYQKDTEWQTPRSEAQQKVDRTLPHD